MYWDLIVFNIYLVFVLLEFFLRRLAQILNSLQKITTSLKANFLIISTNYKILAGCNFRKRIHVENTCAAHHIDNFNKSVVKNFEVRYPRCVLNHNVENDMKKQS
jgi:hypothetical protein